MSIKKCLAGKVWGALRRQEYFLPLTVISCISFSGLLPGVADAEMHRIILDGDCTEWDVLTPVWVDPVGDSGSSLIDFGNIGIAEDEENIYIQFDVNSDLIIQQDNALTLYINTDNDTATGYFPNIYGAELVWNFGTRSGFFYHGSNYTSIQWDDIWGVTLPGYSSGRFEMCICRDIKPDGTNWLFPGPEIKLKFVDTGGSDTVPDGFDFISYTLASGTLDPLPWIDLDHKSAGPRLMTYNVHLDDLFDSYNQPAFERIITAVDPDIIAFQEIYNHSAAQTKSLISSWLGGEWSAVQISDKVLLSRSTIIDTWSIAAGRAVASLVSPISGFTENTLVINAHLSCCDNDEGRQDQVDAIIAFIADAKSPGGQLDLTASNPIVITGDMNFVGSSRQLTTLLTGDILDEATYGPDITPDWDETDLTDLLSRHLTKPVAYTWYKDWSEYWPSRLDFIIYSDSNLQVLNSGVIQTEFMPSAYLSSLGMNSSDSERASDHLLHFADLAGSDQAVDDEPLPSLRLHLRLESVNPINHHARLLLDITSDSVRNRSLPAEVSIFDLGGRRIKTLVDGNLSAGQHTLLWDGQTDSGQPAPGGAYWVRCLTRGESVATRIILIR